MTTSRIQKWGDSLAVRIPKALAEKALLEENSAVELTAEAGVLRVRPHHRKITLRALLQGITKENVHDEVKTRIRVGNETW